METTKPKTYKQYAQEKTVAELISELKGLHGSINHLDCFGTRDLLLYEAIETELKNRMYEVNTDRAQILIKKKNE